MMPSSPRLAATDVVHHTCEEAAPLASFFASISVRGSLTWSSASNAKDVPGRIPPSPQLKSECRDVTVSSSAGLARGN